MPELPDVVVYIEALEERVLGHVLKQVQIAGPSLLRTAAPPVESAEGRKVVRLSRVGKRIVLHLATKDTGSNAAELWLVLHLMIAGRLHWKQKPVTPDGRRTLAAFVFDSGTLTLTEAGSRKRASLFVIGSPEELTTLDPGGIEVLSASREQFAAAVKSANHTLKRSLSDPHLFSGIGNAYSDEILHRAQLSPVALTQRLSDEEITRLYQATQKTLIEWTAKLRADAAGDFPEKVTAFREGMAAHGRYGDPCPRCGAKIQRIRYAANETNYCARCQTEGKLLADRSLSRLLKQDWPRSLEEMEEIRSGKGDT